jgi:hypothetical protein
MNLEDFSNNFTVTVVHFDDSTSNISVNFKVQCKTNGRVSIHTSVVDTTELSEGYTESDVVSAAWNSIKTTVNTWASYNIVEDRLSELSITSTSGVIDLSTFNTHFTVKVSQFELTPKINPTNWSIQFYVYRKTNESISTFFSALVPLTQEFCNNTLCADIAGAAWEVVKNEACNWALNNIPTNSVINTIFNPVNI